MKKRNLLILHLESLSMFIYRMHPELFPFLRGLERKTVFFPKYYSTATSTWMVISDLLYGNLHQFETCSSLNDVPKEYWSKSSLLDDLEEEGYKTNVAMYPFAYDLDGVKNRKLLGMNQEFNVWNQYEEYLKAITNGMEEEPFAICGYNFVSHINLNKYVNKYKFMAGFVKWKAYYKDLDKSIKDIFDILESKDKLRNTTIILYGDHGDDFWQHSLHNGLSHAVEPYDHVAHTPLFIYDERLSPEYRSELMSTLSLKPVIRYLLDNQEVSVEHIAKRQIPYAFSRNLYVAQSNRLMTFNKSYAITDGEFRLVVSKKGLEFYETETDPECFNNLLEYFRLGKDNNLVYCKRLDDVMSWHFKDFNNAAQLRLIRIKFKAMVPELYSRVCKIYEQAGRGKEIVNSEMSFHRINDGKGYKKFSADNWKKLDELVDKAISWQEKIQSRR